jgi:cobalamin biosynthetic protein CobC
LAWQQQLAPRGGWLIVDEAFMDSTPEQSLLQFDLDNFPNLIVLRSLGKFFGLAGLRLGFITAQPAILKQIEQLQGTWPISHPSRWLGKKALLDTQWQARTRQQLQKNSQQLQQVLIPCIDDKIYCTTLFCYLMTSQAESLQIHCAQYGIWLRYFAQPQAVRIGLSKDLEEMGRIHEALLTYKN